MTLHHIEGFEGIVPLSSPVTQVATEDDTIEFMEKHYGGRFFSGSNQFHIRQAEDGKSHALGTGQDGSGQFIRFSYWFETALTHSDTIIVGIRIKFQAQDRLADLIRFVGKNDPTTHHIVLTMDTGRVLKVKRGTTTLDTTATDIFTADTWHYIELSVRIDDSPNGAYSLKVDGSIVLSDSGIDTKHNTVVGVPAGIEFKSPIATSSSDADTMFLDDIYILDDTGSINNDFLGPFRVHLFDLSTVDTSDFAKYGAGSDEVTSVADLPFDDTEGVDSANTSTNEQRYTMVPFHTDAIKGVQITSRAGNTDNKTKAVEVKHKVESSAATNTAHSYFVLDSGTHRGFYSTYEVDPNTSALWTKTNLNAATFGVEIG